MAEQLVADSIEVMLAGWSETSTRGRSVTFFLPEDTDEHPFKKHTVRRGKHGGTRFQMVLVEIADDDTLVDQAAREQVETVTGGGMAKNAGMLCRDPAFADYVIARFPTWAGGVLDESPHWDRFQVAAEYVRHVCCVSSRAMLDHDSEAGERYRHIVKGEYTRWQQGEQDSGNGHPDIEGDTGE